MYFLDRMSHHRAGSLLPPGWSPGDPLGPVQPRPRAQPQLQPPHGAQLGPDLWWCAEPWCAPGVWACAHWHQTGSHQEVQRLQAGRGVQVQPPPRRGGERGVGRWVESLLTNQGTVLNLLTNDRGPGDSGPHLRQHPDYPQRLQQP